MLTGSSSREMVPTELFFYLCLGKANQKKCAPELVGVLGRNRAKRIRIYYKEDLCDGLCHPLMTRYGREAENPVTAHSMKLCTSAGLNGS